jgi:hypothetical protein
MSVPLRDPAFYREQSARCRRLAKIVYDQRLEDELLRYAEEFDEKADQTAKQLAG